MNAVVSSAFFSALCTAGAMVYAQPGYAAQCEHVGTNGMVTMLLCPEGLSIDEMIQEGRTICGDRRPCGAWIWENEADLPAEAPASHDLLTERQVTSSRGVWMHEHDRFFAIAPQP